MLSCKLKFFPQIIKDFYLLGRGELFQAFIDTAQHMLKTPPTAVTEHGNCLVGLRMISLLKLQGVSGLLLRCLGTFHVKHSLVSYRAVFPKMETFQVGFTLRSLRAASWLLTLPGRFATGLQTRYFIIRL